MEAKDLLDEKEEGSLGNEYIIIKKEGRGATSKVFAVKRKDKKSDKFAAKVFKILSPQKIKKMKINPSELYYHEKKILNELKPFNCPYIANIIESGEGEVKRAEKEITTNKYIILDYAERGNLFDYIYYPGIGLKEDYARLIFYKIFKAVKVCHDAKICNRDIKLDNILFDEKFNPKLCDFTFGEICEGQITGKVGTLQYMAPEILTTSFKKKSYDGFMVDIFNLGVALFIFITGKYSFCTLKADNNTKLLYQKKYIQFWNNLKEKGDGISKEFKTLFFDMFSLKPEERPDINKILNYDWFKKIPKDKIELEKLEDDMKKELLKRESIIKDAKRIEKKFKGNESSLLDEVNNRSGDDGPSEIFNYDLKPEIIDIESISNNNYIKTKGNLKPSKIMNDLYYYIKQKFGDSCEVKENENELKFNIIFVDELAKKIMNDFEEDEGEEDNSDEEDDNDILRNDLDIQVKMFESYDGDYLIRFVKKSGRLYDYYQKLDKIMALVKTL